MQFRYLVILAAVSLTAACGADSTETPKAKETNTQAQLSQEQPQDQPQDQGKASATFNPPIDGKITDAQLQRYLKIKDKQMELIESSKAERMETVAKVKALGKEFEKDKKTSITETLASAKAMSDISKKMEKFVGLDKSAVKELGFNFDEYRWVEEKVTDTMAINKVGDPAKLAYDARVQVLSKLKQQRDKASKADEKENLNNHIAEVEKIIQEIQDRRKSAENEASRYNAKLLAKHMERLEKINNAVNKIQLLVGLDP